MKLLQRRCVDFLPPPSPPICPLVALVPHIFPFLALQALVLLRNYFSRAQAQLRPPPVSSSSRVRARSPLIRRSVLGSFSISCIRKSPLLFSPFCSLAHFVKHFSRSEDANADLAHSELRLGIQSTKLVRGV